MSKMVSTRQQIFAPIIIIYLWLRFGTASSTHRQSNHTKFPNSPNFMFGVGGSSYQIEGAWNVSNKGKSIWDFGRTIHGNILETSNGDIACDSYHKYQEDIRMLSQLKVDFYRFSISWTRLFPNGLVNVLNEDGVNYYNNLIDGLIKHGIKPLVTLFHWDTPMYLQALGGWSNDRMAIWFEEYADKLFALFGDRVKIWSTLNEPANFCTFSNSYIWPNMTWPFIDSPAIGTYLCVHNQIRAHAKAYRLYQRKYKKTQGGIVGITLDSDWYEPVKTKFDDNKGAVQLALEFHLGWLAWPIFKNGDYPSSMRERVDTRSKQQGFLNSRLPQFTSAEKEEIFGSSDYLGLNHYINYLVEFTNEKASQVPSLENDMDCKLSVNPKWPKTANKHMTVRPESMHQLLRWIDKELGKRVDIIICENGYSGSQNESLDDTERISYMNSYLEAVLKAIDEGVNVKGYSWWALMDTFEWIHGYTSKFGLYHVDFTSPNRTRTPKKSAMVYQNIVVSRKVDGNFYPGKFMH